MKHLVAAILLMGSVAQADVTVVKNNQTKTVDCAKDKNVSIAASNATIKLKGTCDAVSIDGNNATVTGSVKVLSINGNNNTTKLDAVDTISVNGNNNTVAYVKAVGSAETTVANLGTGNTIGKATK